MFHEVIAKIARFASDEKTIRHRRVAEAVAAAFEQPEGDAGVEKTVSRDRMNPQLARDLFDGKRLLRQKRRKIGFD